jgi:hypothetical protein
MECGVTRDPTSDQPLVQFIDVEYQTEALEGVCPAGHRFSLAIQNLDFEILFEMGAMALLDGYTREAVSSFAAAVERAYMFYVRGILYTVASAKDAYQYPLITDRVGIEKLLTAVRHLSERQLGAFVGLWVANERGEAPVMPQKSVAFRNDCIHKGIIPARKDTMKYGEEAFGCIEKIVRCMKSKYAKALDRLIFEHLRDAHIEGTKLTTTAYPTIVSLTHNRGSSTFEERLAELSKYRQAFWSA